METASAPPRRSERTRLREQGCHPGPRSRCLRAPGVVSREDPAAFRMGQPKWTNLGGKSRNKHWDNNFRCACGLLVDTKQFNVERPVRDGIEKLMLLSLPVAI